MRFFGRSNDTSCPYCYHEFNINKVAFRCSGNGQPGLPPCPDVVDERRVQVFGDAPPTKPTLVGPSGDILGKDKASCPNCGGKTGIRLCPHCHSRLPASLDAESPLFGLVGVRNSGKTVFLSVLHKELVGPVGRRFNASIETPGGLQGYARDLAQFNQAMESDSRLPAQTSRGNRHAEPALYDWKYSQNGKTRSTVFSFYDSAGEDLADINTTESQQYLKSANGIILLLDPFAFPENMRIAGEKGALAEQNPTPPDVVISNLVEVVRASRGLKPNKQIKIPIAVAVAKIDAFFDQIPEHSPIRRNSGAQAAFDQQDSIDVHEHMIALIQQWGGDNLVRKVQQEFETYRFFGVSALGAEPDYKGSTINSRGILPHRVVDPLLWLMANRGFIPSINAKR